jgi:hypothetical protein
MNLTIDFTEKTVKVGSKARVGDLIDFLKGQFDAWEDFIIVPTEGIDIVAQELPDRSQYLLPFYSTCGHL